MVVNNNGVVIKAKFAKSVDFKIINKIMRIKMRLIIP